jgi:hypothetical protein
MQMAAEPVAEEELEDEAPVADRGEEPEEVQQQATALAPILRGDSPDLLTLGKLLAASGFFKDTRSAAQAIVRVLAGRELGIGPIASMNNMYIVQGKLSMGYPLVAALVKRSRTHDYRVAHLDDQRCELEFWEKREGADWEPVGKSVFTMADAQRAGLLQRSDAWKKYPRNLLFARALTNGVRFHCPDIFLGGVYTQEELEG